MQSSNPPSKIPTPWAKTGLKNTVPQTTSGITSPNQASFDVGFPPITMNPVQTGGLPPLGKDVNGALYAITNIVQWLCAGGSFSYDSTFATNGDVGGYPKGAILLKATKDGFWRNTVENNSTNPDTGGAGWVDLFTGYAKTGSNVSQFTNDSGYITASGFAASLNQNGYQQYPSGLIENWGRVGPFTDEGSITVTLPKQFTTGPLNAQCSIINSTANTGMDQTAQVVNVTNNTITIQCNKTGGGTNVWPVYIYWEAKGR